MPLARPVIFTRAAHTELLDAQDWYENEAPGLGRRFRIAVENVVERISASPRQFPVVHKTVRRALLRHFPYALLFVLEAEDSVTVIACFHGSRDPEHWQKRA